MTRLVAYTYILLNVMRSKRFLSHLILTISWCLKNKIRSQWERFTPSYNPFFRFVHNTILVTARIARNTTRFSPNVEQHKLLGFDADRSLPDVILKRAKSLAVIAQPLLLSHRCRGGNRVCLPDLLCYSSREGAMCSVRTARWVRTQSCPRSPAL